MEICAPLSISPRANPVDRLRCSEPLAEAPQRSRARLPNSGWPWSARASNGRSALHQERQLQATAYRWWCRTGSQSRRLAQETDRNRAGGWSVRPDFARPAGAPWRVSRFVSGRVRSRLGARLPSSMLYWDHHPQRTPAEFPGTLLLAEADTCISRGIDKWSAEAPPFPGGPALLSCTPVPPVPPAPDLPPA